MFTVFLLWLFSFRNFTAGTTLSKLEIVAVAIFGLLLLGDTPTSAVVIAIAVSAFGLIILNIGQSKLSAANALAGLSQIELVFTFIVTLFWFREKVSRTEVLGIALIMGSIILLLLRG